MLAWEFRRSRQKRIHKKTHGDDKYRQTQVDCRRTQTSKEARRQAS